MLLLKFFIDIWDFRIRSTSMSKNLVIVESPAKAKTIEGYLGKDFKVASSYGHVRDLPKDDKAIDIENGFKPTYEVSKDKLEVIKKLKKLVKESEMIYLASDDDREGEAISWHLMKALKLENDRAKRIVFREITKTAIINALENPRDIDEDLVNAQQARRILDRLVGFELSPILWKKIKTGLSAGRVQSVAVRMVVERERDIDKFRSQSSFKVTATFGLENGKKLIAELQEKLPDTGAAQQFLESCKGATFRIKNLETKPLTKSPAPPFTTSTLQQEASRKMGFSVAQTMTLAQILYEAGKISYMRTDSVNLSQEAINSAKTEIGNSFGTQYVHTRQYKTKSSSAQEAHEAIRPTNFSLQNVSSDRNEQRLYELIWKRAIASQMAQAQLEKTIATIDISTLDRNLIATGEVIKFEGFLKVYIESTDEEDPVVGGGNILPPLSLGQILSLNNMLARERFTRPPARYTEASLVKKLEEIGIGRPSTYAPTISVVQKRGYVIKEYRDGQERAYQELVLENGQIDQVQKKEITGLEKNKLFPANIGMVVNDFLVEHFPDIINYSFTAKVEKEFDEIASGQKEWDQMISVFYRGFHNQVEATENIDRSEVGKSREIGTDPESGKVIIARLGRYGPIVQIGDGNGEEKPKFASLRKGQLIENITLEEALDLFKLPHTIDEFEGMPVVAAIGKFGPYLRHKDKFYSIDKDEDPLSINIERAEEIILQRRKIDAEKHIKSFDENPEVHILNGRWGPYIKVGKKNAKIPKDKKPEDLTLEECLELAEKAPARKGRRRR